MPKPSIEPFEGDPLDYWAFVNRYDVHIAGRVGSDDLSLAYLLQHCTKAVYDKVKQLTCSLLKRVAYETVWRDLQYGSDMSNFIIISGCCE